MIDWLCKIVERVGVRKAISFLAVGGSMAAAYSVSCTALVHWFPAYKLWISIGVHACLIPVAFLGQRFITFQSSGRIVSEFLQYAALQITSITTTALLLVRLVTDKPLYNLIVFLAIAACNAIVSFAICNLLIFRRKSGAG